MLIDAVQSYLALRRACGFKLRYQEHRLRHFAQFSMARGKSYICSQTAIEWAALARSVEQRTRRLRDVILVRRIRYTNFRALYLGAAVGVGRHHTFTRATRSSG
jgi:hypothetical protein